MPVGPGSKRAYATVQKRRLPCSRSIASFRSRRALAADVADRHAERPVADLEDVVEVATHLVALAGGVEARAELDASELGQKRRQQALLERARDPGALA